MRRVVSLVILIAVSAVAAELSCASQAQDPPDWRMYTGTDDLSAFYSVPSIVRDKDGKVRVWAEILENADFIRVAPIVNAQPFSDILVTRLKAGYVPLFVQVRPQYTKKLVVEITLAEEIANERLAPPMSLFLTEVDCTRTRSRVLQSIDYSNYGTPVQSLAHPSAWQYAAPQTVAEKLMKFVCRPQVPLPATGNPSNQSKQH